MPIIQGFFFFQYHNINVVTIITFVFLMNSFDLNTHNLILLENFMHFYILCKILAFLFKCVFPP